MKKNKGITLISLVITIIILIILASVAINLSLGKNGIFNRAKQAKEQYALITAREKLELVLLDARTEKEVNDKYNSEDFLDNMLEESGIEVNENIVTVDNYNFTIDRENLKIITEDGETNIKVTKEVKSYLGKNTNEKYEAQILVTIESDKELQNAIIENPDGTTLKLETNNTKIAKDMTVEFDKAYKVIITTKEGKTTTRTIIEKSEETIRTAEELAEFRDKVNSSLSYEGKTIKLGRDIDLSSICGENVNGKEISWEPIGTIDVGFHGTFDGQYHIIDKLYINSSNDYQGLFAHVYKNGIITSVIIGENSSIIGNGYVGGIVGDIGNAILQNCENNANIYGNNTIGGIAGSAILTKIENCYNKGDIKANTSWVGGIAGYADNVEIKKCYNYDAIIEASTYTSGGIVGRINSGRIENSYNILSENSYIRASEGNAGGIAGLSYTNLVVKNCYNIGNNIVAKDNYHGLIIGVIQNNETSIENCYYDKESPLAIVYLAGHTLKSNTSIAKELSQFKLNKENENSVAYGLNNYISSEIWAQEPSINSGYPYLKDNK